MTISDQSRNDLHQRLAEVIGVDEAATLMEHLPPVGRADVATKRDLDHFALDIRSEIADLSSDLLLELHREVTGLRVEVLQETGGLRVDRDANSPRCSSGSSVCSSVRRDWPSRCRGCCSSPASRGLLLAGERLFV